MPWKRRGPRSARRQRTSSVQASGGILRIFDKMHQCMVVGVTQPRISDPLWRGELRPLDAAKTDAELNSSLIFRHRHDETSSAVTRSPRLGIPLSQVSAALGKEHRYHPSLLSGISFALAVGYEGSPQKRDVHCK